MAHATKAHITGLLEACADMTAAIDAVPAYLPLSRHNVWYARRAVSRATRAARTGRYTATMQALTSARGFLDQAQGAVTHHRYGGPNPLGWNFIATDAR